VPTLTVFTPTFNRGYILQRCYESLTRQSCKDFLWMVIDDGSTDNTKHLVEKWSKENKISIRYIYQENQGMHGAHNTAYENINTELNVCIDSDDYMPDTAVEKITTFWAEYGSKEVSGFVGLDATSNNNILGTLLPSNLKSATLFDLYQKYGVKGDKKLVYRSELTKRYSYPIFDEEKYVGLTYKYFMIDKEYELLLMNEVLCYVEYLEDGSSLNMLYQYRRNPKGFAFFRKELMKLPFGNWSYKYRQAIHYVASNLLSQNNKIIKDSPNKPLTLLALPLGFFLYVFILTNTRNLSGLSK
jgi:glycosyltransferase involved in cell wall biosynthesis